MKKRRLMKAAVLAMLLAMAGHGGMQAAGTGNQALTPNSSVSDVFDYQIAAGYLASTAGDYATAYGYLNYATGNYATAFGSGATSVAGYYQNSALGLYSTAVGYANTASVGRSTAIGYRNDATIDYGTAVGVSNLAKGMYGTAIGYGSSTTGEYSTAVGNKSSASGEYSTSIGAGDDGTTNSASGRYSSAFGYKNTAGTNYSQAFGTSNSASAKADSAIVMGSANTVDGANSNAFGYLNQTGNDETMAIGSGNLTTGVGASTIGYKNVTNQENSMAIGVGNTAAGSNSMATGQSNAASGSYSFAEGAQNESGFRSAVSGVASQYTTAIGYGNTATGAVGAGVTPGRTVALGDSNYVIVNDSVTLGQNNKIRNGERSVAFGYTNVLNEDGAGIAAAFGGMNTVDSDDTAHPAAAFGYENTTVGIAVGYHNTGEKKTASDQGGDVYPVAIGSENEDSGIGSFNTGSGIGYRNAVNLGTEDTTYVTANAIGTENTVTKAAAIAIGYKNEAGGSLDETAGGNSNAIGVLNVAAGTNSGAFGYRNYAGAENAIAMGAGNNMTSFDTTNYTAAVTGAASVAVGYKNNAQSANSTAFGYGNIAYSASVEGGSTTATDGASAVFGAQNKGYGNDSVALGYGNISGKSIATTSIGGKAGTTFHTVAIGNANTATGYITSGSTTEKYGNTVAVGYKNTADGNYAKAFGVSNVVHANESSAFGYGNTIYNYGNSTYSSNYNGYQASALGVSNVVGYNTTNSYYRGQQSTAVGVDNKVYSQLSMGAGYSNTLGNGNYNSVFGVENTTTFSYSLSSSYGAMQNTIVGFSNQINGTYSSGDYYPDYNTILGGANEIHVNNDYVSIFGRNNKVGYNSDHTIFMGYGNQRGDYSSINSYAYTYLGYLGTGNMVANYAASYSGSYQYLIGSNNQMFGTYSLGVGYDNYVDGYSTGRVTTVGIGNEWYKNASSSYATSYSTFLGINNGQTASFGRSYLQYIGIDNTLIGNYSTVLGQSNSGTGSNSSALGKSNVLSGSYGIAVGFSNTFSQSSYASSYNMAVGTGNVSGGTTYYSSNGYWYNNNSTAVGSTNQAKGLNTSAFGYGNTVGLTSEGGDNRGHVTTYSAAIGANNIVKSAGTYYNGTNNTEDQKGLRSYALGADNITRNNDSTALGYGNTVGGTYTGSNYKTTTPYNIAIGAQNEAGGTFYADNRYYTSNEQYNSYDTTAVGFQNKVTGWKNTALGYDNVISGPGDVSTAMNQAQYRVDSSAAVGQSNVVKAAAAMVSNYTDSYYAGGQGSYTLGHDNVTQAPYSTAVGASNTVGGTRAYNKGQQGDAHLDNTALGTGNTVGAGTYQDSFTADNGQGTQYRAFNTYSGTGIGFQNIVGSNYATAAGYHNTIANADKSTSETELGLYTVTYSVALGQENIIRALGETELSGLDQRVLGGEYSYAIGYGNTTQFAGSTALGFSNVVGADSAARSVASGTNGYFNANTAIGTSNVVGGLFVTDKDSKTYQVSYATGIGVSNVVAGEEATAVGVSNEIKGSRDGHQNKEEKNRSAALGSGNVIYNSLDTIGETDTLYADVYNYAIGTDNEVRGAGNLAVGNENVVGGNRTKQETADAANTAIGANNVVGGWYTDAEHGEANGRYNLGAGFGNFAIGQENTAIGIENTIAENVGTLEDSANSTQHNVLVGISNTVSNATYTAPRMYNVGIGEGNTFRNGYDTAIGFYNTVGGEFATNVDNITEKVYHVALGSQNTVAGTDGTANGIRMTAIGSGNTTYGRDSVAIGKSSVTGTENEENDTRESAAIGVRAVASSMKSLAVGVDVTAQTVTGAVAVGQNSTVSGEKSSAFGVNNVVSGTESLAVGTDNDDVFGNRTIVVGTNNTSAVTTGAGTTDEATTGTNGSVIFGVDSTVMGDRGIVFGVQDTAAGGSVAAGFQSKALGEHSLAMGYAQEVTADAAHGTAVGSGYERTEGSPGSLTTHYYGTTVSGVSGAAFGVANLVSGNYATAVGSGYYRHTEIDQEGVDYFFQNTAAGDYSAAFGYLNSAEGEHSLAAGTGYVETVDDIDTVYANIAKRAKAAALGYANQALAEESLAAGGFSRTGEDAKGATAIGEGYVVELTDSSGTTTVRRYNEATGAGATALGFANIASGTASTAAGSLSKASDDNATALGVGILKETKDGDKVTAVEYIENTAAGDGATAIGYANQAESDASTALGSLSKATGVGATAAGAGYTTEDGTLVYNEANGTGATAFGYANVATGNNATALGSTITVDGTEWVNQALSEGSTAIGSGNTAGATGNDTATAIGVMNRATGTQSVAIGVSNEALAEEAIFLGTENETTAAGTHAAAIGTSNTLGGTYSLALGTSNQAKQAYAIAIGAEAQTGETGSHQIAMSYRAQATGDKAVAIGYQAKATAANSIAFGTNAQAAFANSVAIGTDAAATDSRRQLEKDLETTGYGPTSAAAGQTRTTHTVSFGNSTTLNNVTTGIVSRLTNVAEGRETKDDDGWLIAGVGDTDAVNVKQLKRYIEKSPVFYDHRNANASPFTADGSYITTNNHWLSTDFWQENVSHGKDSTAYGYLANAKGETSSALGYGSTTDTTAKDAIAMAGATVTGESGIAIGNGASAEKGAAIGTGAISTGGNYAIGASATASTGTNAMALGAGSVSTGEEYTISVGDGTNNHRIVNLADAQINKAATDYDATAAVNVETMQRILDTMPEQEAIVIFDDDTDGSDYHTSNNHWVATDFDLTGITHGTDSTGYGYGTQASGTNSTAIGYGYTNNNILYYNQATANYASAFGTANTAGGLYSLAAGVENTASGNYATAVGYTSVADKAQATALGYAAQATGEGATAVGNNATASAKGAIAIGSSTEDATLGELKATASGEGATAIGLGVTADGAKALALGALNTMSAAQDSSAVGAGNAITGSRYSGAFGTGNTIGTQDKAYALGFGNTVSGTNATALGDGNTVSAEFGTAAGFGSQVSGARGFAAGVNAAAQAADAMAAGSFAVAAADSSVALGAQAYATAENSTAIGYQATAVESRVADDGTDAKINTVSFGHKETDIDPTTITQANPTGTEYGTALTSRLTHIADGVSDTDAANVRQLKESTIVDFDENYPTSDDHRLSTDFGYEDKITHGKNSAAYGYQANAAGENSVALGYQAYAGDANGVALGAESVAVGNVVSVGHQKDDEYKYVDDEGNVQTGTYDSALTRRITNVATGTADTDLVNVAQAKEELKTAGIVKWDGKTDDTAKHYLATFFENTNYYTPGANSSAYGYLTKATGEGSVAFGYAAHALADNAVALGSESVANGNVISIGHAKTDINPETNAAYGTELTRKIIHVADGVTDETAENYTGTDLVNVRTMKTTDPVKSGTDGTNRWVVTSDTENVSYTPGTNATAYGLSSQALGAESTAIGYGAVVKANAASGSVAIGANSVAERVLDAEGNPVAVVSVGGKKTETEEGTVIETRRITNVADGITDTTASNYTGTDLVTYQQLKLATAEGGIVDYDINYKTLTGEHWLSTNFGETGAKAENSTSFGYASKVSADRGAALGYNASVTVADGVAIGADSVASVAGTVSVGHTKDDINPLTGVKYGTALTRVITGLAFGEDGTDAVSVDQLKYTDPVKTGTTATATGENHYLTTLDPTAYTPGENSVAYGLGTGQAKGAYAFGKQAVAFGLNAYAPAENAVALGEGSYAGEKNAISLGHTTEQIDRSTGGFYTEDLNRKITGVANAVWDENSDYYNAGTDLVNVYVLREHTKDAPGIVRTIGDQHNLYTELNDSGKVNPAEQAVAYGKQAYAAAKDSFAFGYQSYAGVEGGVALGANSVAKEANTVSVGHQDGDTYYDYDDDGNYVEKQYEDTLLRRVTGLAFGVADTDAVSVAQLKLTDPVKTGTTDGVTDENHWLATPMGGGDSYARGENSVAYGYDTAATAKNAVAFGYAALAQQENAVAIGADSVATDANTVSVGHKQGDSKSDRSSYQDDLQRRIIHVADGVAATDLINVSQLNASVDLITVIDWDKDRTASGEQWLSTDFGYKDQFTHGVQSTAYGHYANAQGQQSAAIGYGSFAGDEGGVALGAESVAKGDVVSVGHAKDDAYQYIDENGEVATGTYTEALTRRITNVATGTANTDLVNVAQLKSTDPIKAGSTDGVAETNHWLATDMGTGINGTPGTNSAAYGFETKASGENAVAYGYRAVATGSGSVALGALSAAADDNVVSVGHKSDDLNYKGQKFMDTLTRRIVNVKAGREDIDAATGKYVYGTDLVTVAQLNRAAATSGGVVEFNGDYEAQDDHYLSTYIAAEGATHNATSAAYGFMANVAADATNGAALGYDASVTAANATAIGAGAIANEANTVSVGDGTEDGNRRITNVADGITDTTAENYTGTDAVTVGQLHRYYLPKSGTDEEGNTWIATTYGSPIAPGKNSAAYGDGASAQGEGSVALGSGAVATDANSVVIGAGSVSAGENTISVGDGTEDGNRRITNVEAGREDVDADGNYIYGNDAVNYKQLKEIIEEKGVGVVKYDTKYTETGDHRLTTVFEDEEEEGTGKTSAKDAVAFGYRADASYEKSVAFGAGATVAFESSVALGAGSVVYEANTISVGDAQNGLTRRITNVKAGTADTDMVNVSQLNAVKDVLAINGIKDGSTTTIKEELDKFTDGVDTFKQDVDTFDTKVDTFKGDVDTFQGDVDDFQDDIDKTKENLGNQGITADSNISEKIEEIEKKLDDFTGGATKGTEIDSETGEEKYKDNQTAIGQGSAVDGENSSVFGYRDQVTGENATGMGTTNIITGNDSTGIGSGNHIDGNQSSAYGFDNHVTGNDALAIGSGNEARGDGTVAIGKGAWATGTDGVAIGTGAKAVEGSVAIGAGSNATEKGTVSFGDGTEDGNRRLTNLAEGKEESDVATYGRVKDLQDRVDAINTTTGNVAFDRLDSMIDSAEHNISKVGAGAAAIAALHPLEFDPSEKVSFAIGYGNYRGENAMAVGAFVRPNESIVLSLGGAVGNGDNLVNSSISFALGSGPSGLAARSKAALAKQVNEQDEKIAARDEEIARLRSLISQLESMAETEEQKAMAHEMVIRSEAAELEELRSMAQQLVATASADQLRSIVKQLSANQAT